MQIGDLDLPSGDLSDGFFGELTLINYFHTSLFLRGKFFLL